MIDLVIETEFKPHDIAPLIPIIAGAGGIVTTWETAPARTAGASSRPATARACGGAEIVEPLISRVAPNALTPRKPSATDVSRR